MAVKKEGISPVDTKQVLGLFPPFPIVLVTTQTNIITIGQVQYFTFSPLRIGIAVAHERHTYSLLKTEREFVVNVPDAEIIDAVKLCGDISGKNCDKFTVAGLTREQSHVVRAESVLECGANIECRVEREIVFENRTWFIGEVVAARSRPDHRAQQSLLCGRTDYAVPGENVARR